MRRLFKRFWHMITGGHDYVWSNSNEGMLRCKSCRHLRNPSKFATSEEC